MRKAGKLRRAEAAIERRRLRARGEHGFERRRLGNARKIVRNGAYWPINKAIVTVASIIH